MIHKILVLLPITGMEDYHLNLTPPGFTGYDMSEETGVHFKYTKLIV